MTEQRDLFGRVQDLDSEERAEFVKLWDYQTRRADDQLGGFFHEVFLGGAMLGLDALFGDNFRYFVCLSCGVVCVDRLKHYNKDHVYQFGDLPEWEDPES